MPHPRTQGVLRSSNLYKEACDVEVGGDRGMITCHMVSIGNF